MSFRGVNTGREETSGTEWKGRGHPSSACHCQVTRVTLTTRSSGCSQRQRTESTLDLSEPWLTPQKDSKESSSQTRTCRRKISRTPQGDTYHHNRTGPSIQEAMAPEPRLGPRWPSQLPLNCLGKRASWLIATRMRELMKRGLLRSGSQLPESRQSPRMTRSQKSKGLPTSTIQSLLVPESWRTQTTIPWTSDPRSWQSRSKKSVEPMQFPRTLGRTRGGMPGRFQWTCNSNHLSSSGKRGQGRTRCGRPTTKLEAKVFEIYHVQAKRIRSKG
mmetsp:Transcript_43674/g.68388  ORF Transcript_43674/g.68388 Transcript_43674/m.68388 type:complete len:273 (+) Transcript_43674:194-1012(+)